MSTTISATSDAEAILALPEDTIPDFLRKEISTKRLHALVVKLNRDALGGPPVRRDTARAALKRLGFV
ncbi:hypothetical protein EKE94_11540 [Mesobaculum littorinae]|uniref:Uncharacterized protein n=1 Tax=Mesobaculum littorinae TaxID=2486419 RepID=A0A438AH89_9RHOB|nr:hypothetical protein [Mesobaculum littorinae]RVV98083.1 hypothetical protein EKE94_11540 [Mesobaculum littorinae]